MLSKTCTRILRLYGFEDVHTPLPAQYALNRSIRLDGWGSNCETTYLTCTSAPRPARRCGPWTCVGLIDQPFRQSRSAKASPARWACHGCPWFLVGASPQRRRPDCTVGTEFTCPELVQDGLGHDRPRRCVAPTRTTRISARNPN